MMWIERIAAARQRGSFNADDRAASGPWNTCAVGEAIAQRHAMPWWRRAIRPVVPYPINPTLSTIGLEFVEVVFRNEFDRAEEIVRIAYSQLRVESQPLDNLDAVVTATVEEVKRIAKADLKVLA